MAEAETTETFGSQSGWRIAIPARSRLARPATLAALLLMQTACASGTGDRTTIGALPTQGRFAFAPEPEIAVLDGLKAGLAARLRARGLSEGADADYLVQITLANSGSSSTDYASPDALPVQTFWDNGSGGQTTALIMTMSNIRTGTELYRATARKRLAQDDIPTALAALLPAIVPPTD